MHEGGQSAVGRILTGVRVLDITRFLSGPQATLFLAGLGAEVIRIDDPAIGDPTANAPPYFGPEGVSLNRQTDADLGIAYLKRARGKKAISLNLKSKQGLAIFFRLVEQADVLVENFRVGVTKRLGIDHAALQRHNPMLIHCAITGYGSTGADRGRKAFDLMVQAATGLMSITGDPEGGVCKTGSPLSTVSRELSRLQEFLARCFNATGWAWGNSLMSPCPIVCCLSCLMNRSIVTISSTCSRGREIG